MRVPVREAGEANAAFHFSMACQGSLTMTGPMQCWNVTDNRTDRESDGRGEH